VTEQPTASSGSPPSGGKAAHFVGLYRRMRLIRRFEDEVRSLSARGLVHGTTHLCSGQEAGAVGVCDVLGPEDRVAATYRGHGVALALGVDPERLLAELLGRTAGVCGGRAGSMNVVDFEHRLIGCFGIGGGSIAAATGAALALKRVGGIAVAFFADGAANQGYFHECLNLAKVRELPVIYVCETNRHGELTPHEQVTAGEITARPQALGLPTITIDGNDVWTVRKTAAEAVERVRGGMGPHFIESLTDRYVGDSRANDPLLVARAGLTDRYGIAAEAIDQLDEEVDEDLAAIVKAASEAPFPEPGAPAREFAP
jgi:acetoin:2,6-dichlorophenolindophenol oxidoreductase subunit alpha